MERSIEWQMKRRVERRAAALEDMYDKVIPARRQCKTQTRRRGFASRGKRPKKTSDGAARLRRDGQALQLRVAHLGQPGGECMAASRAQSLLARP
jgi:hypothetical protein